MSKAKLNDDSLDLVLGVVQETHRMHGSLSTEVPFAPMICFFNPLRMARLVTSARLLV